MKSGKSTVVCIIPARGGSKGIPRKNIRLLGGKPLIAHSIEAALTAKSIDEVYVSTEDEEIASVSLQYGAKVVLRPEKLAGDTNSSESALLHAQDVLESSGDYIELVVFLQCTSPFRTSKDIDSAILQMRDDQADSLLSVVPSHKFLWKVEHGQGVSINYDYRARPRRQDMQQQYAENGSIYIYKPWVLRKFENRLGGRVSAFIMGEDQMIDIDSESDWQVAECILALNRDN
ncbi:MAG: acylneuraminate cytidylyltransferase family protein [Polynucleobacter sp.]|uniref:acylneuraminate cytidylyltransferase family protein n=1 Tax=Polynucleobacter sp. TaxID=2029855 RepID=UPI00271BBC4A|nr:acylneuraminate cytidylyltransferase family protein [Polynucleobacter sp.]MDO8713797.1 acylneuraminate cytidylyltransferase family protein [Polynucleobacter sp.]